MTYKNRLNPRNLSRWIKIGSFTVYKKVVQYESKGYVVSETVKNGNMPEKTVYTKRQRGKEFLKELMTKFSLAETRVFLDFNAVIVNMALLDENSANECIANIKNSIQNTKMQIAEQLPTHNDIPLFGRTILEQTILLLETLEKWEENFEKELVEREGRKMNLMYFYIFNLGFIYHFTYLRKLLVISLSGCMSINGCLII